MGKHPLSQTSAPTGEEVKSVRSSIGAHRTLVRPAIAALTVRLAIGTHRILVRPVIAAFTVRSAISVHRILVSVAIA